MAKKHNTSANLNNNQNNQGSSNNHSNFIQQEEDQIIDQSKNQLQPTSPIFGSSAFDYKVTPNHQKQTDNSALGQLRRKFAPLREKIYRHHLLHEPSARKHRRFWYTLFGVLSVFFLMWGAFFWKQGVQVLQTPIGQTKTFINGDTVKMSSLHYDPHKHIALVYLTIHGANNTSMPAYNINSSFQFQNGPNSYSGSAPTIQTIPIYQDHYVVVLRHMYHGAGAISIQLTDKSRLDANSLVSTIQNDNGTDKAGAPTMGATIEPKKAVEYLAAPPADLNNRQAAIQDRLIRRLQTSNFQFLIISPAELEQNHDSIPSHLNSKQILVHIFKKVIKHNEIDKKLRQHQIKEEQGTLKSDQKRLHDLYKNSSIANMDSAISSLESAVKSDQRSINIYNKEIKADDTAINQTRNRLSQTSGGVESLPTPQPQNRSQQWNNAKDGK